MGFKRRTPLPPLAIKETGEVGLYVSYALDAHTWGSLDDKIDRVVGQPHVDGGTSGTSRELDYYFDTVDQAKKAAERIQRMRTPGITVSCDE